MRKALNDNPTVQIAVVGVLILVVGLFVVTTMGKKKDSAPPASSSTPGASGATTTPVTVPDGTAQAGASGAGATVAPPASGGTVTPDALIPGPGLPMDVVRPRRISGSVPEAQVSYGFRNSQSVVQAVHDALYTGHDNLPYYPG